MSLGGERLANPRGDGAASTRLQVAGFAGRYGAWTAAAVALVFYAATMAPAFLRGAVYGRVLGRLAGVPIILQTLHNPLLAKPRELQTRLCASRRV